MALVRFVLHARNHATQNMGVMLRRNVLICQRDVKALFGSQQQ